MSLNQNQKFIRLRLRTPIASVTKETIGGEAVEMLSFAIDDTGVVGEVSSETIDL